MQVLLFCVDKGAEVSCVYNLCLLMMRFSLSYLWLRHCLSFSRTEELYRDKDCVLVLINCIQYVTFEAGITFQVTLMKQLTSCCPYDRFSFSRKRELLISHLPGKLHFHPQEFVQATRDIVLTNLERKVDAFSLIKILHAFEDELSEQIMTKAMALFDTAY